MREQKLIEINDPFGLRGDPPPSFGPFPGLFNAIPAGVRLDSWEPKPAIDEPAYAPEIEALRDEFRKSMPEVVNMLDALASYRVTRDLAGRLAAPQQSELVIERVE